MFKKKNLFKVGNEGGATGGGGGGHHHTGSDQLSSGSANQSQSQSHQRVMMMHRDNSYMLHAQPGLNYSHHIPVAHQYTQIQAQNFIPTTNHGHIGYEFPAAVSIIPSESSSPPPPIMVLKQLMAARDCESGSDHHQGYQAATNNCDSAGLEVGLTCTTEASHQSLVSSREEDQQNLNDWPGMIDHHRLVATTPHLENLNEETSKSHVRSTFEDANTSSMTHINQLSLRNEMDFWSYGK